MVDVILIWTKCSTACTFLYDIVLRDDAIFPTMVNKTFSRFQIADCLNPWTRMNLIVFLLWNLTNPVICSDCNVNKSKSHKNPKQTFYCKSTLENIVLLIRAQKFYQQSSSMLKIAHFPENKKKCIWKVARGSSDKEPQFEKNNKNLNWVSIGWITVKSGRWMPKWFVNHNTDNQRW